MHNSTLSYFLSADTTSTDTEEEHYSQEDTEEEMGEENTGEKTPSSEIQLIFLHRK